MPTDLSIKKVPDEIVARLKERARRNHRSLQGELMAIVEAAASEPVGLTPTEILNQARKLGLPAEPRSVEIIRHDRDHEH